MTSLKIADYQLQALRTDQHTSDETDLSFPLLGVFGETGSLLSEVKKKQRDTVAYVGYQDSVIEELGDVLWYISALAARAKIGLDELAGNLDRTPADWQAGGSSGITFETIDAQVADFATSPSPAFERSLLALAGEVGLLMTDHNAGRLEHNQSALKGRLVAILRALRSAAHEAGVTLEAAARSNLAKIFDRWPTNRSHPPLFDDGFPQHEQLPRHLVVDITEVEINGRKMSQLCRDGVRWGDPLTDNREDDDDYRFHDIFHLSYAAHLGWSPTLRRLLKVKRKSDPRIDEVQDGARAVLIEEGIATWIFNHGQQLALFERITSLDYGLLKSVRRFVAGYEAEACPLWLWEEAILRGYEIFRDVRAHRGGRVTVDLNDRSIRYDRP